MQYAGQIVQLARLGALSGDVRALAAVVATVDGAEPLDEAELLDLDGAGARHIVFGALDNVPAGLTAGTAQPLLGYAQVGLPDIATGDVSAGLVVGNLDDRDLVADVLLQQAEMLSEPGHLLVWARSAASPVTATARRHGYTVDRVLRTMSQPLSSSRTWAPRPAGVTIRGFVPGQDEQAWLAVNGAAFAGHPEQGRWTLVDLDHRLEQDWFDPSGFLLAVDDVTGDLLGFHWTKLHAGEPPIGRPPIGEVYVIGTAPRAQGRGLGHSLLAAGLAHLQASGARDVILYVDESNPAAVRLYERSGFTTVRRQVQYRRP